MFYRVPARALPLVWPQAKPHLIRGIPRMRGRSTITDIENWLLDDSHQLWVATRKGQVLAAIVTEVLYHASGKRMFDINLAAGSQVRLWLPEAMARLSEYCHLRGATQFRVIGRKGWTRLLAPYGFKFEAVVLSREEN
jgi:hypothetical protein